MCDNKITYYIPKGYAYRPYDVPCGNTDPHGELALCPDCEHGRDEREAVTSYCLSMGFDM